MSFQEISLIFNKIKGHIDDSSLTDSQKAYPSIRNRLQEVRRLYLSWIDVYEEYRRGFEKEKLTVALYPVARFLSSLGYGLENSFFEVVHSRIPVEVHFLVSYCYNQFQCPNRFVLAEGRIFETDTVFGEISAELKRLPAPEPHGTQARTLLTEIQSRDYTKISYESVMFDSALTWPLLLHEAFHEIYEKNKLAQVHKSVISDNWVTEVIIDLYSAMFFGPVYAVSLAKYHERFPSGGSISHPSQGARLYGLLQLLGDALKDKKNFSENIQQIMDRSFRVVNDIWSHYRREKLEIQDKVQEVYESAKPAVVDFHHSKGLKTFDELVAAKSPENRSAEIDVVSQYLKDRIPAACDPRVLFNVLMLADTDIKYQYVAESLKKWHVWEGWSRTLIEGKGKLA